EGRARNEQVAKLTARRAARHRSDLSDQLAHPARSSEQQPIIVDAETIEHLRILELQRRSRAILFCPSPHNIRSNTLSGLKEKLEARSNSFRSLAASVELPHRFSKTVGDVQ